MNSNNTQEQQKQCNQCKTSNIPLNLCAGCLEVSYCTIECQKKDWKQHKSYCQQKQEEIKEKTRIQQKMARKNIDWFERLDNVGQGNFSIILKMKEKKSDQIYAIKVIEKRRLKQLGKENDILMEKHALEKLKGSQYVIELLDTFHDEFSLYIQMEYVDGGELWNYCRIFGLLSKSLVKYFFAHILKGLEYMHSKGIIHRDLKPENILVTKQTKCIKFCDFGTSRDAFDSSVQGSGTGRPGKKRYEHFVGTPNFMPPECMRNKGSEFSSDIYCLGGTIFQLVSGFPPYLGKSEFLIFYQSERQDPIFWEEIWGEEPLLKDLILKMMKKNLDERITIENIKQHEYFKGVDWDNLIRFEECFRDKEEIFLNDLREYLVEQFDNLKEKENDVLNVFKQWADKLQNNDEFNEIQKQKIQKRMNIMKKQAKQFFNCGEFFWQEFEYAGEVENSIQKINEQEEEQEEDDK